MNQGWGMKYDHKGIMWNENWALNRDAVIVQSTNH